MHLARLTGAAQGESRYVLGQGHFKTVDTKGLESRLRLLQLVGPKRADKESDDPGAHVALGDSIAEFLDPFTTNVAGANVSSNGDRWFGEVGIGGSIAGPYGFSLYGEVSALGSLESFGDTYAIRGTGGLSKTF